MAFQASTHAPGTVTATSTEVVAPTATATKTTTETSTNIIIIIITETATETTTATLTAYAQATSIVANGASYPKQTTSFNADLTDFGFTSSYFKTATAAPILTPADRSSSFQAIQATLLLRGFSIARETGTHTLYSPSDKTDDWGYLWLGGVTYSEWNDSSTAFQASRTSAGHIIGARTVTPNACDAILLTWLWLNGGGVSQS
ncbi:hypothetical protein F5Y15DRAFT_413431 [Xylariaceae sp. FL0016]|nr:hypothetical protein F5Y15DRAFT_413431 [Xylariaceae sp. FL0016]